MKTLKLDQTVAVVTGGNGGIGLGIAKGLAEAGAAVVITGRDAAKNADALSVLQRLQPNCRAEICDIRDRAAIKQLFLTVRETLGPVDILVNNAGIAIGTPPEDISEADWDAVLDTNLKSVFWCCQDAFADLQDQSRSGHPGKIINIASLYSIFGGARVASYSASKGGIVQMTKALAVAWAPNQIQVNAIIPGWINTEMTQAVREDAQFYDNILARTPAGRFGQPEELAGAAVFLASQSANFVTGVVLPVDGGYSAG
ncbi:glucose 1-dehydrogenase [Pseudomonadales bacterium]|jgi:2-dehydro-3-deoxy-D-gluconate 5-dehydrogenase|nr:glucose 1-dehydrogenase [Pseudomonadales bacterium]